MNRRSYYFISAFLRLICLAATPMIVLCQSKLPDNISAKGIKESELKIERMVAETNDLPSLKTTDLKNGAVFQVYFDETSTPIAEQAVPVLAAFYRELAQSASVDGGKVKWHSVVFTQKTDYVQPRREGDVRWSVVTGNQGELTAHGIIDLYMVVPHEQVHAIQKSFIPQHSMRWFKEGQATWLGMKITERWNPELARREREILASEQQKAREPLALRKWGSVRVSGSAIMQQMTAEEREKLKQNPGAMTSGSFTFSSKDLISDESNAKARYGAALNIFEEVEKKAGPQKTNEWLKSIWEHKAELSTDVLIELTLAKTSVDIRNYLL